MPFAKPPRRLQRFRRFFTTRVKRVSEPATEADVFALILQTRGLADKMIAKDIEGREWYSREEGRQRSKLYKAIKEAFEERGWPSSSSVSQFFATLDRKTPIKDAPLVYGNKARSLRGQKAVEAFLEGTTLTLKPQAAPRNGFVFTLEDAPPDEWFVQAAEVRSEKGNLYVDFVLVRSKEMLERDSGEMIAKTIETSGRVIVCLEGEGLYLLDAATVDKIRKHLAKGEITAAKLKKFQAWVRKNGTAIGKIGLGL